MYIPIPSPVAISPVFNDAQLTDNQGNPLAGGKLFTYAAGSNSDEQITFTTESGAVANANPIVLDSSGRLPNQVWLANGFAYNLILTKADGTTVLRAVDNVRGSYPAFSTTLGTLIWNPAATIPVYVDNQQFYLDGDQTLPFTKGNRVQWVYNDGSFGYGVSNGSTHDVDTNRTYVLLILDSVNFSNVVTSVAWSSAIVNSMIVDAGAVGYTSAFAYAGATVGTELQYITSLVARNNTVWDAINSIEGINVAIAPGFATLDKSVTLKVKFDIASYGQPLSLNVGNLGLVPLMQYGSGGTPINPTITVGMVSEIAYDGTQFILLDPLPSVPVGTIMWYPAIEPPSGWAICSGGFFSATTQPDLFAVLGYTFGGEGDQFGVPNLLGQFVRGYDGSGAVDPGRTFGSIQAGQMQSHNHRMVWEYYDGGGGRGLVDPVNPVDITTPGQGGGNASWGVTFAGTGSETRPTNIALTPCIKI
jgi:hypothetical protein